MESIVFVKEVPDVANVEIDPRTNALIREGVPSILNPFDAIALEQALRIKEQWGGTVTVVSMGPPQAKKTLKTCIAIGADQAYLLSDPAFAGSDTLATSFTLSLAIKRLELPYDLLLCGSQAIDGDTGQVGPGISEFLSIPLLFNVSRVSLQDKENEIEIMVHRDTDFGYEVACCQLPALLTVVEGLVVPRAVSLKEVAAVDAKRIKIITSKELNENSDRFGFLGSPTEVVRIFRPSPSNYTLIDPDLPADKRIRQLISGIPISHKNQFILKEKCVSDACKALVEKLGDDGIKI